MKYKLLDRNQIIISIDRLTRFKPTDEKYLRVFNDIIISNLIEPKIKKSELECLPYSKVRDIATEIFNASLKNDNNDFFINQILRRCENQVFNNTKETDILLNNNINYNEAIKLFADKDDLPINLKWLSCLSRKENIEKLREEHNLLFPIRLVVIVEGITEEILLPRFAEFLNFDFNKYGVKVLPAGGKNQVVKLYYSLSEKLNIPIFVLLDKDANENEKLIKQKIRNMDKVHLLSCGEFEDLLPESLIIRTVNLHFANFSSINMSDFDKSTSMVKTLEEIFKEKGTHEFKKAEFAHLINEQIHSKNDISTEIENIISEINSAIIPSKSLI